VFFLYNFINVLKKEVAEFKNIQNNSFNIFLLINESKCSYAVRKILHFNKKIICLVLELNDLFFVNSFYISKIILRNRRFIFIENIECWLFCEQILNKSNIFGKFYYFKNKFSIFLSKFFLFEKSFITNIKIKVSFISFCYELEENVAFL
jgi:hypothetical protein